MMTLNHGFSGYFCARVALPALRGRLPVPERQAALALFLGAMMPDLDVLARLVAGPGAYFSHAWYGHRQASHSVLGTLLMALLAAGLWLLLSGAWRDWRGPAGHRAVLRGLAGKGPAVAALFWAGGLIHLVGDYVTPGMAMPLLWPLEPRFGALSHIGWFTPYLLVLFLSVLGLDGVLRGLRRAGWLGAAPRGPVVYGAAAWLLYAAGTARWLHYLAVSRYEGSASYLAYQSELLPSFLIEPLNQGVRTLWIALSR